MVRIQIKGGVWKNSEDEILKAAVMKYGMNQWARVATLLNRKTPKQVKARWFEWLDPAIKKTEWTREEDEKLLHLAKILPTQWRTIAPMIGRTAIQCLERYEQLLNAAGKAEEEEGENYDPKKLRPGEMEPVPEAKPARPDAVDMEEDEKEMLQEARARLANTKGKKAKRKAREKKLEEARRLAQLQKIRELKAAGIELKTFKKKRDKGKIDFLTEVPFEKRPAPGFFDIHEENKESIRQRGDVSQFIGMDVRDLEGRKSQKEVEEEARKKDAQREKLHRKTNLPQYLANLNKMNDPAQFARRMELNMPSPQITEKELEEMARLDPTIFTKGGLPMQNASAAGSAASSTRTPSNRDDLILQAQNLIAMNAEQTPLKGGENSVLHPTDFRGMKPQKAAVMQTPNLLLLQGGVTPQIHAGGQGGRTPQVGGVGSGVGRGVKRPYAGATPSMTPIHDELSINQQERPLYVDAGGDGHGMQAGETRRMEKARQVNMRKRLKTGLDTLPSPANEYGLVMPDLPVDDVLARLLQQRKMSKKVDEDDAEDVLTKNRERDERLKQEAFNRISQALQKGLPRPKALNASMGVPPGIAITAVDEAAARQLVCAEVVHLLRMDAVDYPNIHEPVTTATVHVGRDIKKLDAALHAAKQMVNEELAKKPTVLPTDAAAAMDGKENNIWDTVAQVWQDVQTHVAFLPNKKQYGWLPNASEAEKKAAYTQEFDRLSNLHQTIMQGADKLEQQVALLHGGYMKRQQALHGEVDQAFQVVNDSVRNLNCFAALQDNETRMMSVRTASYNTEIKKLKEEETRLQNRYTKLRDELEQLVEARMAATANT